MVEENFEIWPSEIHQIDSILLHFTSGSQENVKLQGINPKYPEIQGEKQENRADPPNTGKTGKTGPVGALGYLWWESMGVVFGHKWTSFQTIMDSYTIIHSNQRLRQYLFMQDRQMQGL